MNQLLESVNIKKIEFGSEEDKEKSELKTVKIEKKEIKDIIKKEEIKKEEKKSEKEKKDEKKEKSDINEQYETVYLKNLVGNIDYLFQNNLDITGFGEISKNLIDSMISQKQKEKKEKEKKGKFEKITKDKKTQKKNEKRKI